MQSFQILKYYSRPDIQKEMLKIARDREVVGSLRDGSYLKRPDSLVYPKDIEERVKRGVVSFHCSVERWIQPMQLSLNLRKDELASLRRGFDIILDIDTKTKLEHAAIAARVVCEFLKDLGISPTIKFSGSRGFHIGISYKAFPKKIDFKTTSERYPEIPQTISEYIRDQIKDKIWEELVMFEGGVAALTNTLPSVSELTPDNYVNIDKRSYVSSKDSTYVPMTKRFYVYTRFSDLEKNWGNRHLFRMPYSLHTKFWLVSLPIKISDLKNFNKNMAKPENVKTNVKFLVNKEGEATELFEKALDWKAKQPKEIIEKPKRIRKGPEKPVLEDFFPPCMKLILSGLSDGRKRSLFTLCTFLRKMNWKEEEIEKRIKEWNNNNSNPLSDRFINTQLKWHFRQSRELLPANCFSDLFYVSIGVCKPDQYCNKNPINYYFRKVKKRPVKK